MADGSVKFMKDTVERLGDVDGAHGPVPGGGEIISSDAY